MGIDYTAGLGTTIHASADGVVTVSEYRYDWGQYVKIDHGGGYSSLYAHMIDGSRRVARGQSVTRGTPLGLVGSTGYSTGAHLHIEVYIGSTRVDPDPYVDANKTAPLANASNPPTTPPAAPKIEDETMYYRATSNSSDGLIISGYTYVNSADGPLRALNSLEGGAVSFWNFPVASWSGHDIRQLVKIVGLRTQGAGQGLYVDGGTAIVNDGRLTGQIVY